MFISEGDFPSLFKNAVIKPLKPQLPISELKKKKYWPVSSCNLLYIYTVIEHVVAIHRKDHITNCSLENPLHSATEQIIQQKQLC